MNFLQFLKEDTTIIVNTKQKNEELSESEQIKQHLSISAPAQAPVVKNFTNKTNKNHDKVDKRLNENIDNGEESFNTLFNKKRFDKVNKSNNLIDNNAKQKIECDYKEFTFKPGDYVKVIRPSPRPTQGGYRLCDIYCGYYGTIKKRFKSTNYASVILDAPNNNPTIHFPIEYLDKINDE